MTNLINILHQVVSKESHDCAGYHYHVGLQSKDASKNTCTHLIRQAFSEFSGSQCNVKFHKGWGTLIGYITKEDQSPYVWGIYSLSEILAVGVSSRTKKKNPVTVKSTEVILDCFRSRDEWLGVYESPEVRERLVYGSYSNLKQVYEDVRVLKEIEFSSFERITEYLKVREQDGVSISEYSPEELSPCSVVSAPWVWGTNVFFRWVGPLNMFYAEPRPFLTLRKEWSLGLPLFSLLFFFSECLSATSSKPGYRRWRRIV
ncbi:hypothetical protein K1719_038070 [Acacia pycnantha]|nr:hypothetical protein K1719_038070 [Acacia pycnantha]